VTGSLGLAPSANLNPTRTYPSMFEPVHGSAPDIAGQGIANPMATVLAGAMLVEFLDERDAAVAIEQAVARVLAEATTVTRDLGGRATTDQVTAAIVAELTRTLAPGA
jgi:tartrate dehydrogenase/decarboxylase/D-malate dehydrogenase